MCMPELSEQARLVRLRRRRVVLRVFNGAGLGVLLGGMIGAVLGVLTLGLALPKTPVAETLSTGAFWGVLPGMFGGFWIGMTAVMRDGRAGIAAGTAMGALVGLAYGCVLGRGSWMLAVLIFTVPCGVIGGLLLSSLIRGIRARWGWLTRWEE